MDKYDPAIRAVLDDLLLGHPLVRPGKMFGYPAYYTGKKLCICLYEQAVGLKLPEGRVSGLLESDAHAAPFQPLGRPRMREWVQISLTEPDAYRDYLGLFEEAIAYAASLQSAA